MVQRLDNIQQDLRNQIKTRTLSSISSSFLSAGFMGCYLVAFLWGAARLHEGTITYGMMIAFIQLVGQIQGPFRDMSRFIPIFVNAFYSRRTSHAIRRDSFGKTSEEIRIGSPSGIRFHQVSYACRQGRPPHTAKDFTYDFPPGSHTAVIGGNRCRENDFNRLMLSLIHPTAEKSYYTTTMAGNPNAMQVPCPTSPTSPRKYPL